MSTVRSLIKALIPHVESQLERDEAYLAQSIDVHEFERRMREIDSRGRTGASALALSIGLR